MAPRPTLPLQPYVPRLVTDWLATSPEALVRTIDGSMVFVDVSGFTTMSERLARHGKVGAEEVTELIDGTFTSLLREAYAFGGSLLKFGGDALLLFFSGDDHPSRAVAAAHGMRAELRRIGTFQTTAGKVTLRMSAGAHTGTFHFFLVGDSHRELIVAGPAASETVTMEGAASAGRIVLSPMLAAALPRANRGRRVGPGVLLAGAPPEAARSETRQDTATIDLEPVVPVALRETVLAGEVEPEHRSVTIAFVHYGGFDELVMREGPDAAAAALDSLVRSAQHAAAAHGVAFLASDIAPDGGKIILTAGAPVVTGADEEQSLLTVRELVAAAAGRLSLHVGVNTGPVYAGAIGPAYRRTYTVMGDAVNLAARLMARAAAGEVVAAPAVLDASRTIFETRELEPFLVKGKRKPVTAFAVGGARGSRTTIAEAGLPLLGRDVELRALLDAWGSARAGSGRVVELSADPGMGKSRLLDEFLARAAGARVIRVECRLYQSATPYFPFRALLRAAFGLDGLDDADAVAALASLVDERAPALAPWLSLIATPLDLDVQTSPEVDALEDRFRRARLEETVAALLAHVADEPAVVVIEDTHWMDEPSRDLLACVTGALRTRPWLFVLSHRPGHEGPGAGDEDGTVVRVELEPLGLEPAIALIHAATEDAPLRPRQERELAARAAGNPLYLIELLDALRRGDDVDSMPGSVQGLIHARIDTLPTADRRRLRALSVLGIGFRAEHATGTLGVGSAEEVRRTLRGLGEFLSVDRAGWVEFRHALIRDAAYEGLPYRRRQELHAQVGDAILAESAASPEDASELLAVHYWHARRWAEAWTYSCIAGDRARGVYANVEAARFYERALGAAQRLESLDALEQARVAIRLGEARGYAGLFEAALDALQRARKLTGGDAIVVAELHERRARILMRMGQHARAYRETGRGLRAVEGLEGAAAARARSSLSAVASWARLYQGRPREALPLALRAVQNAEIADETGGLALALSLLNDVYVDLGRGEEAVFADRAIELYASVGNLQGVASVEMSVGVRAYSEGRWDDAVAAYVRAQDVFRRAGDEAQAAIAAANIGEVLVSQGKLDEAEPIVAEAVRVGRAHGAETPTLFGEIQHGRLLHARGELDEAIASLERTRDEAVAVGMRAFAFESGMVLAEALVDAGEALEAQRIIDDEQTRIGEYAVYYASAFARARARVLIAVGRLDAAEAAVVDGLAAAREHQVLYDEAQLLLLRSELVGAIGPEEASEALEKANRLLQRLGVLDPRPYGPARAPSNDEYTIHST